MTQALPRLSGLTTLKTPPRLAVLQLPPEASAVLVENGKHLIAKGTEPAGVRKEGQFNRFWTVKAYCQTPQQEPPILLDRTPCPTSRNRRIERFRDEHCDGCPVAQAGDCPLLGENNGRMALNIDARGSARLLEPCPAGHSLWDIAHPGFRIKPLQLSPMVFIGNYLIDSHQRWQQITAEGYRSHFEPKPDPGSPDAPFSTLLHGLIGSGVLWRYSTTERRVYTADHFRVPNCHGSPSTFCWGIGNNMVPTDLSLAPSAFISGLFSEHLTRYPEWRDRWRALQERMAADEITYEPTGGLLVKSPDIPSDAVAIITQEQMPAAYLQLRASGAPPIEADSKAIVLPLLACRHNDLNGFVTPTMPSGRCWFIALDPTPGYHGNGLILGQIDLTALTPSP